MLKKRCTFKNLEEYLKKPGRNSENLEKISKKSLATLIKWEEEVEVKQCSLIIYIVSFLLFMIFLIFWLLPLTQIFVSLLNSVNNSVYSFSICSKIIRSLFIVSCVETVCIMSFVDFHYSICCVTEFKWMLFLFQVFIKRNCI